MLGVASLGRVRAQRMHSTRFWGHFPRTNLKTTNDPKPHTQRPKIRQ